MFYDDSQCDLRKASSLLKVQDIEGALDYAVGAEPPGVQGGSQSEARAWRVRTTTSAFSSSCGMSSTRRSANPIEAAEAAGQQGVRQRDHRLQAGEGIVGCDDRGMRMRRRRWGERRRSHPKVKTGGKPAAPYGGVA